jgi:hypothetical protein
MRAELDQLAAASRGQFVIHYVLSRPVDDRWTGGTGWVSLEDTAHLPKPGADTIVGETIRADPFYTTS